MKVKAVWAATCFIWGTLWLAIKIGLRDLPPLSFAALRLVVALAVLLPLLAARRVRPPWRARDWAVISITGLLLLGLNYALVFWGTRHISSGLAAILQSSTPAFGLLFTRLLLPGMTAGVEKLFALALGVLGVAVIFAGQLGANGGVGLWGCAAVLGGAFSVGLAYVVVKAHGSHIEATTLAAGQMFFGALPLVILAPAVEGSPAAFHWSASSVGALLYLALAGSVVAFRLNYWLLERMEPTAVMSMAVVEPLLAAALGAIVLGERVTPQTLAGGVCILLSVVLVMILEGRRPAGVRAAADLCMMRSGDA